MQPIIEFKSHIAGKNSDVAVYADRIEWAQQGGLSTGKAALGAMTLGTSLLKTGISKKQQGSEVIPVKAISSVTTKKDGLRFTNVSVICAGNTIDFRVSHNEAEPIKQTLTSLMLGSHPAQQAQAASQPATAAASPPPPAPAAPPPPAVPAGWHPDPHRRHELRYWDGAVWTSQVSDGGTQSTDAAG